MTMIFFRVNCGLFTFIIPRPKIFPRIPNYQQLRLGITVVLADCRASEYAKDYWLLCTTDWTTGCTLYRYSTLLLVERSVLVLRLERARKPEIRESFSVERQVSGKPKLRTTRTARSGIWLRLNCSNCGSGSTVKKLSIWIRGKQNDPPVQKVASNTADILWVVRRPMTSVTATKGGAMCAHWLLVV